MDNRYLSYLVDPVYDEDYGVSPSRSRLAIAGVAVGASLLFLRTPMARDLATTMFRRIPQGQTAIERGLTSMWHQRRELRAILRNAFPDDEVLQNRLFKKHYDTLRREFVQRALNERGMLIGRAMGLRPVTVRDILERRFPIELRPFRLMRGPISGDDIGYLSDASPAMMEGWMRKLAKEMPEFMDAAVDPGLFKTTSGELVDLRGMQASFDAFVSRLSDISIPVVNWNLGQIARLPLLQDIRSRPAFAYFRKGAHQPFVGGVLKEDVLLLGRRLVSLREPDKVLAEGVYTSFFGTPMRAAAQIAQATPHTKAYRSGFHQALDLGAQADESWFSHIRSIFTKGRDPADVRGAMQQLLEGKAFERPAEIIHQAIMQDPMPLPAEMMQTPAVREAIQKAYPGLFKDGLVRLETQEDLIETLYTLVSRDALSRRHGQKLLREWQYIARSPESYFKRLSFTRERLPQLPYGGPPQVRAVPQEQRLRHLIQMEMREYMREVLGQHPAGLRMEDAAKHRALKRMTVAEALAAARNADELRQLMLETTSAGRQFRRMLQEVVKDISPWYAPGYAGPSPSRHMAKQAGGAIIMREWIRPPSLDDLRRLHDPEVQRRVIEQTKAFFRQFGAGRHRPEDFTTASLIPYHMMSRLNDMFSFFGLGLSQKYLGSAQQIFLNILGRRYIAGMALAGYAGYLAWEMENLTGFSPKQAALDALAGINVGWARLMNITGITSLTQRMEKVMPGSELIWELPVVSFFDPRWEAEELAEWLVEGEAPVRRGRWWQFGNTPIQGGAIDHFWPSWYRRFSTDWEFTHVGWGDRDTAYAHWWLPTPRYPLAPIRHFITDPYYLEEMWGRERPYPISGPIPFFENLPVIGPLLSATVGRILKPPVRMYEEELLAWQRGELDYANFPHTESIGPIAMTTPAGLVRVQNYLAMPATEEEPQSLPPFVARLQAINEGILARDQAAEEEAVRPLSDAPMSPQALVAIPPEAMIEGPSSGILSAAARLRAINEATMARSRLKDIEEAELLMEGHIPPGTVPPPGVPVRVRRMRQLGQEVPPSRDLPGGDSLRFQLAESYSQLTDIGGLYGFLLRTVTGGAERSWEDVPRLATPRREITLGRWFRDLQIGGFPGELSEVGRRLIPTNRYYDPEVEVNPLRNLMPSWMPGEDYFINFHQGDPYAYLSGAMYRLPGPGFEMMQGVAPLEERLEALFPDPETRAYVRQAIDQGIMSPYETYGLWERFKILADVAPYSDEYQYYANLLTQNKNLIPPAKLAQFQRIKRQVSEYKRRERFFPYRFRDADLEYADVTVRRVIDNNTFIAYGMDRPVRLAGLYVPTGQDKAGQEARDFLSQFVYPGARVTIGYAADELRRYGTDQLESVRAIVIADGVNVNRALLDAGIAQEREADDPASVHVHYSAAERAVGRMWESFAHMDTFIHTKFLQVRSPYEMYRRRDVYGKDWQAWHRPISDFLIPTLESFAASPPYVSALYGYGYGRLVTIASQDRRFSHRAGLYGAALFAGLSLLRAAYEWGTGETWIPRRRRIQRDFELYFSALEYVKYRGIYEFAARRALEEEGFDVHAFFGETRKSGRSVVREREALEALKRELIIEGPDLPRWRLRQIYREIRRLGGEAAARLEDINHDINLRGRFDKEAVHAALIRSINARINYLGEQRRYFELPPWAEIAVMARERYESTIYGMDLYGHLEPIIRGLPRSERRYITEFLQAPESERQKILDIAPIYTRRVLQARWGMEVEPLPSLEEVFSRHFLPPVSSGLWSPAKSLEDVKLKTAEAVGIELTELGFWPQDERRAERHEAPALPWLKPVITGTDLERTLKAILEGQGLEDVWVRLTPSQRQGVRMQFNIKRDPSSELRDLILNNPHILVGGP